MAIGRKNAGGRPSLYPGKGGKVQVRAITKKGAVILDKVRRVVKSVSKWPGHVSDGDVIDYLLRVWHNGPTAADDEIEPKK